VERYWMPTCVTCYREPALAGGLDLVSRDPLPGIL